MSRFHPVVRADEIPPGTGKTVLVDGRKVALFNVGGRFHAIDDRCPHAGGSLGEGILDGCVVTCPYHFWQFDVRRGCAPEFPEATVVRYEVRLENGLVSVSDSPVADGVVKPGAAPGGKASPPR